MKNLNSFLKLVDKKVAIKKNSAEKESLHKDFIDLFFNRDDDTLNKIRQEEQNWINKNIFIETFNEIFTKDLKDIDLSNYLDYDINYSIDSKKKENELIFQFSVDNDIKIEEKFFDDVIKKDNGDIEIKYKLIYKKDSFAEQLQKKEFNRLLQNALEIGDFQQFFTASSLIKKDISNKTTRIIIKFKFEPTVIVKSEYKDFIKIQKDKVTFKKQDIIKNPFLENEKYFLIKLQDEANNSPFDKYQVFKNIFTYFKNSIATKNEKITYTPDDLAQFSSELLYGILKKLNFFDEKKIVFSDYLCGSGNLAMSFVRTLEDKHQANNIKYIYLNDVNTDFHIGSILNEYLTEIWDTTPDQLITNIKINHTSFPAFHEEGAGRGRTRQVLPNIIMSNPDFNNEVEELKNIFIEKSNQQAVLLLYYGKVLRDIPNYTKLVIKLDSSEIFLNTSSKVYLNIFIPDTMNNNLIKSSFINIPDIERYFHKMHDSIWKEKKRSIQMSLVEIVLRLIFDEELKNFSLCADDTYVILNDEILLDGKINKKYIKIVDNKVFIDEEEELLFEISEYKNDFIDIIEDNCIYYISNNEINFHNIPKINGNVNTIILKKYEELKGLL